MSHRRSNAAHLLEGLILSVSVLLFALAVVTLRAASVPPPLTVAIAGDLMLGRGVAQSLSKTTVEAAFGEAATAFEGADIAFANLESVLTVVEPSTGKSIHFKGKPERVDVLQLLVLTHVSVANNHVDDYAKKGWADSVKNVAAAGIKPVGGYANDGETIYWADPSEDGNRTTVAFLAYDDTVRRVDKTKLAAAIAQAAKGANLVLVSFHWGAEYKHLPNARQVDLAHAAIDAGADVIIGSHPHVLEGIERYQDGLILYSMGNFIFDQIGADQNETMVARLTIGDKRTLELIPMRIRSRFPKPATKEERQATLDRVASWSDESMREEIKTGKINW
jgi:poly-gamma-glutamate synthesis protein (capsule biosynthesis protein)